MMIKTAAQLIKEAQQQINCLDPAAALSLYKASPNPVIIDVREADSAAKSKLSKALNISRGLLELKVQKSCPDPSGLILTHCAGGGRASLAALTLQDMGYTNVHAITASFDDIKAAFG